MNRKLKNKNLLGITLLLVLFGSILYNPAIAAAPYTGELLGDTPDETGMYMTWVCPEGVTLIKVECWGGGGGSDKAVLDTYAKGICGGGGGAYASKTFAVEPGSAYSYYVGRAGDAGIVGGGSSTDGEASYWISTAVLRANGGRRGTPGSPGLGGSATAGIEGVISYAGGNGGNGYNGTHVGGGGGGGAAGPAGPGQSASFTIGGQGFTGIAGHSGNGAHGSYYAPPYELNNSYGGFGYTYGGGASGPTSVNQSMHGAPGGQGIIRITNMTPDTTAPTVSTLSPADNSTDIGVNANLVMTMSENVIIGTGNIVIKKSADDSIAETINVAGPLISGNATATITINPSVSLEYGTAYYIQIASTAFKDAAGNYYAGIADAESWSFTTTAPTAVTFLSAVADGAADSTTSTQIDLTFDASVTGLTADSITITDGTGAAVKGALSGSGTTWAIALTSVTAQGSVSVEITAPTGYVLSGSPITVSVHKAIVDADISPGTVNFDKFNPINVQTGIIWNSAGTVTDVTAGGISIGAENYSLSSDTLTIKKEYLACQAAGSLSLTIAFNLGSPAILTVNITDTTPPVISPSACNYDLYAPADVTTTIAWNSAAAITGVDCNTVPLTPVLHYTVAGNTLTILNSCLSELAPTEGTTLEFIISFNTGADISLTVTVVDSYVPSSDADLSDLKVNGTALGGFSQDDTAYAVELPYGSAHAAVTATANDLNAVIHISQAPSLPGTATVTVTAENGTTTKTYTISFTLGAAIPEPYIPSADYPSDAVPTYKADVTVPDAAGGTTAITLPVTVDADNGGAAIDVSTQESLLSGGTTSVITTPSIPGVDTYTLGIPAPYLSMPGTPGYLVFNNEVGSLTIPSNMLNGVSEAEGNSAQIHIGQGDKAGLPEAVRTAIGDRPLIMLSLSIDEKQTNWNNPAAHVTVSIPYTPTAAELLNPENIVIWYIDGSGEAILVPNGHYDPSTGAVTFNTTHFSYYAIGYNKVNFSDVEATAWYDKAVCFIAARAVTTGTGDGKFSPDANLTRGDFLVMLMRAYGITPDTTTADNFSDAGNTYYTSYLAAAKRLGISNGIGGNMYAPDREITRQEMFTLLYNALKVIGQLPEGNSGKTLSDFTDAGQIEYWARDAMTRLAETGAITGNNNMLTPEKTATRAEMAHVLFNLLSRQ